MQFPTLSPTALKWGQLTSLIAFMRGPYTKGHCRRSETGKSKRGLKLRAFYS